MLHVNATLGDLAVVNEHAEVLQRFLDEFSEFVVVFSGLLAGWLVGTFWDGFSPLFVPKMAFLIISTLKYHQKPPKTRVIASSGFFSSR